MQAKIHPLQGCPNCTSTNLESSLGNEGGIKTLYWDMQCIDCGFTWQDVYTYTESVDRHNITIEPPAEIIETKALPTWEIKTNPWLSGTRWEDRPVLGTFTCTMPEMEEHALFLSAMENGQVRFNEQGLSQGHYVIHPDVLHAWTHPIYGESRPK